jgi:hypothetical protein
MPKKERFIKNAQKKLLKKAIFKNLIFFKKFTLSSLLLTQGTQVTQTARIKII